LKPLSISSQKAAVLQGALARTSCVPLAPNLVSTIAKRRNHIIGHSSWFWVIAGEETVSPRRPVRTFIKTTSIKKRGIASETWFNDASLNEILPIVIVNGQKSWTVTRKYLSMRMLDR
jgi:hypothetical protein